MVVEVSQLRKSYGNLEVLKGLDMNVPEGRIYGFLGRNGAGKSTTLRVLVGILQIGSGSVRLFGEPMAAQNTSLRQRIGYVAQEQNFYGWMTPESIGRFVSGFYPNWDNSTYTRLLQVMELPPQRQIQAFSGGMKAKQALALALAHRPPLLVLDEPTAGLDPVARREFFELVREQTQRQGNTVLFSSHLVDEVERSADQIGILESGTMHYEGPLSALRQQVRMLRLPDQEAPLELESSWQVLQDRRRGDGRELVLRTESPEEFANLPERFPQAELVTLSLEDIFIEMVTHVR